MVVAVVTVVRRKKKHLEIKVHLGLLFFVDGGVDKLSIRIYLLRD